MYLYLTDEETEIREVTLWREDAQSPASQLPGSHLFQVFVIPRGTSMVLEKIPF